MRWPQWLLLVVLLGLTELSARQASRISEIKTLEQLANRGSEARATLESELNAALHLTIGMTSYIQSQGGEIQPERLSAWIHNLIQNARHVRNIGLAPDNRIQYVFPKEGNEGALGLYYPDLPDQWPAVAKMIRDNKPTLTAPVNLKQGGRGFIYRVPIFVNQAYWGLISTVINADSLLALMDAYNAKGEEGLALAGLSATDANTFTHFWGRKPQTQDIRYQMLLNLPNTQWQLTISRTPDVLTPWLVRVVGWLIIASGMIIYLRWQHDQRLQRAADQTIRAQQEFNSVILDRVMDGILTLDVQGRLVSVNRAASELLGLTDSSKVSLPLQHVLDINDVAHSDMDIWLYSLTKTPPHSGKLKNTPTAGRDVEVLTAPLLDVPQAHWLVLLRDISDRLRNERMKNEFVATISHELRTPLTSIAGALSLLANGVLGELNDKARQMVIVADANARRLTLLINDLLDMEKLLAGHMRLNMQPCEIDRLLEQAINENRAYADKYEVALTFDNAVDIAQGSLELSLDPSRMMQVMANLLSNAIKYSPPKEVVTVRLEKHGTLARINVIDHGPGIPEGFHSQIFQKFTQADGSDTRQKGGTGLGLAITKELVEHMGGHIGFTTDPRKGTCFHVDFPILEQGSSGMNNAPPAARVG